MLYRISKKYSSPREVKKIKNVKDKAYKKQSYYRNNSSGSESDSYSYLSNGGDWYEEMQNTERTKTNRLDHIVTDNKKSKLKSR